LLGIECDGASYHSAKTARDRDRLRQLVLEELGWHLHRVWSTDWWRDPRSEIEKIEFAIRESMTRREEVEIQVERLPQTGELHVTNVDTDAAPEVEASESSDPESGCPAPGDPLMVEHAYQCASLIRRRGDFYDSSSTRLIGDALAKMVEAEEPVTMGFAIRRIGELWGFARMRQQAQARVRKIAASRHLQFVDDGGEPVLWMPDSKPEEYNGFRVPGDDRRSQRSIAEIPTWEFANAAQVLLVRFGNIGATDLMRETARLFGFRSLGSRVVSRVELGLERLLQSGRAIRDGEHLRIP